jgi:regulatory protein
VLAAAARLLEVRQRTTVEMGRRLLRAGYPAPLVTLAVERLAELGLLDDEAFARAWVESRDRAQPRGERVLRTELRTRGVARELVDRAMKERQGSAAQAGGSADELAAQQLLDRRRRSLDRLTDPRARRNWAYGLLARNGFDPDVSRTVAARVAMDPPSDGGDESP